MEFDTNPKRNADDNRHDAMKLESWDSAEKKKRWKVVRLDTVEDVPGDIISADESFGECMMDVAGEQKTYSFGYGGIRIVQRNDRGR